MSFDDLFTCAQTLVSDDVVVEQEEKVEEEKGEKKEEDEKVNVEEEEEEEKVEAPIVIKRKRQRPIKKMSTVTENLVPKKRRWRSGTQALREIKKLQKSTETQIPRIHIYRVIREILAEKDLKLTKNTVDALHQAGEDFINDFFLESLLFMVHSKRVKLHISDVKLAKHLMFKEIDKFRSLA